MNHQGPQIPEDVNDSNLYRAYRLLLSVCETGVLSRACDRTGCRFPLRPVFSHVRGRGSTIRSSCTPQAACIRPCA